MNKYISDFLPAVMVKDLRQALRSRGYVALLFLCAAGAWLSLLSREGEEAAGAADLSAVVDFSWVSLISVFVFLFCIPWRAGSAVKGDTRVKGTNFLMLTPITSRCIVWSVWLSAAVQMAVMSLLFLPLYVYLEHGGEDEVMNLIKIVGMGLVMTGIQMFASRLHPLLRFALLAYLVKKAVQLLFSMRSLTFLVMQQGHSKLEITAWQYGGIIVIGVLTVALLLEFCRRYYAPLSENCSGGYRCLIPLTAAVGLWLQWQEHALIQHEMVTISLVEVAGGICLFAALADAAFPSCRIPAHDRRCVPWLPKLLQVPGVSSATLWLAMTMGLYFLLCVAPIHSMTDPVSAMQETAVPVGLELLPSAYLIFFCLLAADICCKRESPLRPVVFCVLYAVLSAAGEGVLFFYDPHHEGLQTLPTWMGALPLPSGDYDGESLTTPYHLLRIGCGCVLFGLLLWRGRLKRSAQA